MHIVVCKDYEEMSRRAAEIVAEQIKKRPDGLISFPGGDTPLGMVHVFADMVNEGNLAHALCVARRVGWSVQ